MDPPGVCARRPDEHVVEAVAVDVPRPAHANAGMRIEFEAAEGETAAAQGVERRRAAAQPGTPEDHVGLPAIASGARVRRPDEHVVETVAVDVTRTAHAQAGIRSE